MENQDGMPRQQQRWLCSTAYISSAKFNESFVEGGNFFIDQLLQWEKSNKVSGTEAFRFDSRRLMKDTVSLQPYLVCVLISARIALVLQVNLNPLKLKVVTSLLKEGGQRHLVSDC